MKLLLDSHTLFWWLLDSPQLSPAAKAAIADEANEVLASAVNVYELLFKAGRGRLPVARDALEQALQSSGLPTLNITPAHAARAAKLAWDHGDPWDRLLAAQAQAEPAQLVSKDEAFDAVNISRLW